MFGHFQLVNTPYLVTISMFKGQMKFKITFKHYFKVGQKQSLLVQVDLEVMAIKYDTKLS